MVHKTFKITLLLLIMAVLAGCCTPPDPIIIRKTIEVEVPVYTPVEPPAYLLSAVVIPGIPVFYKPAIKGVTSCLKHEDEIKLKTTIFLLSARISEWLTFASMPKVKHD